MPNVWDVAKAGLRGKFIAVNAQIKKEERSQIGILTVHLNELEKRRANKTQSQQRPNFPSQSQEIVKITVDIKQTTRKTIGRNSTT